MGRTFHIRVIHIRVIHIRVGLSEGWGAPSLRRDLQGGRYIAGGEREGEGRRGRPTSTVQRPGRRPAAAG